MIVSVFAIPDGNATNNLNGDVLSKLHVSQRAQNMLMLNIFDCSQK